MEKICEICGAFFETDRKNRKYCDDCSAHTEARRREYERAVENSKRRLYEPPMFEGVCEQCGKEIITFKKTLNKINVYLPGVREAHVFCSAKCKATWQKEHDTCDFCGKPLKDVESYDPDKPSTKFCNDECKEAYRWESARKNGYVHKCARCGKEFIRKGSGTFCSNECYRTAVKEGWRPPKTDGPPLKTVKRYENCPICGKRMLFEYDLPLKREFPLHACSDKCQELLDKHPELTSTNKDIFSVGRRIDAFAGPE